MPQITAEEQQSSVRISELKVALIEAIRKTLDRHPDLTCEEVLTALVETTGGQLQRLRRERTT